MSPRWIRRAVLAIFVLGIAGMIAASIAERTGAAITAGLITAVAMLCLVLVTSVAPSEDFGSRMVDEDAAAEVEERVADLVTGGADEAEVRSLVRAVRRLERRN
jgi:multisubunit Na+/H+ antiporter MnhB subunit